MTRSVALTDGGGDERLHARRISSLVQALGPRPIVLVGLMGSGKTSTGRCLARRLGLEFVDADHEIEAAAGMTIADIFARHGEAYFRDGERRVMARLLESGPRVIATGGGAYINDATRAKITAGGIAVWLKADLDVLWRRVKRRAHRPLLRGPDPEGTLRALLQSRYPIYERADITVISRDGPHEAVVEDIVAALEFKLRFSPELPRLPAKHETEMTIAHRPAVIAKAAHRVPVELPGRAYDIFIGPGLLRQAGEAIARLAPSAACAIVSDETVAGLHLETLEASFRAAGVRGKSILVPPGEGSKSYAFFESVCDGIIEGRFERGDLVVALGGGVIGDLTGFAAASVRRGMRFVQIPTTLLAQVDSSVGGKTGINSKYGKNLVGAFHQPSLVLADTDVLKTLSPREFAAGYAEVVKYGLLGDAPFFEWLEAHRAEIFAGGPARAEAVARSCTAKAGVVTRDEHEHGERALLNLGHTFGHAFERLVRYDGTRLVHGEGVAIGMACAFRFSHRLGLCAAEDAARAETHLKAAGLPTRIQDIPGFDGTADAILDAMRQDKKVERGNLTFILVKAIGAAFVAKGIEAAAVEDFLATELA
ncbi:MAG: 3-dehydroquinate synthase [Beijerinckiaceae bacterium]|nr:3-dehydroquinate synthase [Beijerinckiaceae bacterium]